MFNSKVKEDFNKRLEEAKKKINIADHLLNVTLPLLGDYKLLIIVVEDTFLSSTNAITALLEYDMYHKRIPFSELKSLEDKIKLFKKYSLKKYNLTPKILNTLDNLKKIIERHRESPVVFVRNKSLVICNDTYSENLVVTLTFLKEAVYKTKIFIQDVTLILKQ